MTVIPVLLRVCGGSEGGRSGYFRGPHSPHQPHGHGEDAGVCLQ